MKFTVSMWIEGDGKPEDDNKVVYQVEAESPDAALDAARGKLRRENPELNHMKVWFWTIRRLYG